MSIEKINSGLPTTTKIEQLNSQTIELNGLVEIGKFDKNEIDSIYDSIRITRKYLRNVGLGNTLTTYTGWSHIVAETGYSIWKYIPSNYSYDILNNIYFDNKVLINQGLALSETATSFTKVFLYDGSYIDNTSEASTELGTEFSLMATTTDYLYVGLNSTFNGIAFDFHTRGIYYTLNCEYWNGSAWTTLTSTTNSLVDNTSNFASGGTISFIEPSNWALTTINSSNLYYVRIKTTTIPTTVAKAYSILPTNSVISLLSLSSEEISAETWKFCTYNNAIYVTIRNAGNTAYEGNYYITSSSSTTNKQNFFIYNHEFTTDYLNSNYNSTNSYTFQLPVIDKDIHYEPESGLYEGLRYLLYDIPSSDPWSAHENHIAEYNNGSWNFTYPTIGMLVYVNDESSFYIYNGLSWTKFTGGSASGVTNVTASLPLSSSGGTTPNITIALANGSTNGYLSSTDWTTFNNKQSALGYTAENTANKVTSISAGSTDTQYGSAKLLYDQLQLKLNLSGGTLTGNLTISDKDIVLGTTTGTKFGTSAGQKLAFFGSTPINKPSGSVLTALTNLGLVTNPTITLDSLSDVDVSSGLINGEVLMVNNGLWKNQPLTVADLNVNSGLTTNHTSNGVKTTFRVAQTTYFGDVCYINSLGKAVQIDADSITTMNGICICCDNSISTNNYGNFLLIGIIRDNSWSWQIGKPIYGNVDSSGMGNNLTQIPPTGTNDVIQILGVAIDTNKIYFNPSLSQAEHI